VDPYRSPPTEPQFICVVCYKSLSVHAGECQACGVDRLPLSDPEVRETVRAEAERRLQLKHYGEWFWLYLAAWLMTAPTTIFFGALWWRFVWWIATTLVVGGVNVKLYERLNARSALRLYADRRKRHELEAAGTAPKALPARADDPEDAELSHVLGLLGARVDEKK
jgi:hypothetical protein